MNQSTSMYRVRPATDKDGDGVGAIIKAAFDEHPGCIYDREAEFPELDAIASCFRDRNGAFWVAEDADRNIVGSCGLIQTSDSEIELHKVYLAESARGTGLATQLLNLTIDYGRTTNSKRITLWTDVRFISGQRFYEKHGFKKQPGSRQLDDLSRSEEFNYTLEL